MNFKFKTASRKFVYALEILLASYFVPDMAQAISPPQFSGLMKLQTAQNGFDNNSAYTLFGDSPQEQYNVDARLMIRQHRDNWDWDLHYQIALQKSKISLTPLAASTPTVDTDKHRLWDLSREISKTDRFESLQRLDRVYLRYSRDQWVVKAGRQAISWGHGQFFNPMDIANPFDPVLIDKEYKAGDDMLYLQWLQDNGNDVQSAIIPRRDDTGKLRSSKSTLAVKYRGLWQDLDYDVLVARHYGDNVVGVGANIPWQESNINSDWLFSKISNDPQRQWIITANVGISYSWTWWNKNIFGHIEYFHNGYGLSNPPITTAQFATNRALIDRLDRGELYTLAKNYFAGGLNIELHPLFLLDINTFLNLHDPSATLQIVGQYNRSDNSNISSGLIVPIGADGSEYGGIDSGNASYYSRQFSLFAKLTYYL